MDRKQVIVPMCGISAECAGLSIYGWLIEKINKCNTQIFNSPNSSISLYNKLFDLIKAEDVFLGIPFFYYDYAETNITDNQTSQYFMVLTKKTDEIQEIVPIMNALRMCSSSMVGCWYPLIMDNGQLKTVGSGIQYMYDGLKNENPILKRNILESEEFKELLIAAKNKKHSETTMLMMAFFHEACRTSNQYLGFIMHITILEMLIDGNMELTYRISHCVAVLLGKNKEESIVISEKIKKMYGARSSFLHMGKYEKITDEMLRLAFDYSRRIIANLMMIQDDISDIRNKLDQCGYGDNPYKVKF